jgi:foldase protein PrsA
VNRVVVSLLALIVVSMAGCGSLAPYAATVDGDRLSRGDLEDELEFLSENEKFVERVEAGGQIKVRGRGKGTLSPDFVAAVLTQEIVAELVNDEVVRRGLEVDAQDLAAARRGVESSYGGKAIFDDFPERYAQMLVRRAANERALAEALPEIDVRSVYEENRAVFEDYACVSHILVADRAKADELAARISRGEDFAALARAESTDNRGEGGGSAAGGGDLGCQAASNYVPEFARAVQSQPVGAVGAPVQTQFGFHLIKVTARPPTFEQLEDQLRQQVEQQGSDAALSKWLETAVDDISIEVNPRYGTFSKDPFGVVAPKSGSRTTTTTLRP